MFIRVLTKLTYLKCCEYFLSHKLITHPEKTGPTETEHRELQW